MRFIRLDEKNKIISIRYGKFIADGEIQSDVGELGQIMQKDGSFIDPEPIEEEPQSTMEDKVNFIYYKSMGVI